MEFIVTYYTFLVYGRVLDRFVFFIIGSEERKCLLGDIFSFLTVGRGKKQLKMWNIWLVNFHNDIQ